MSENTVNSDGRGGAAASEAVLWIGAALWSEIREVVGQLKLEAQDQQRFTGVVEGVKVVGLVTGVGGQRAVDQLIGFMERHGRPRAVLWVGFAGGLDPAVLVGTIVKPRWVLNGKGDCVELFGTQPPHEGQDQGMRPIVKRLLTQDLIVGTVEAKRKWFDESLAGSVDMESFHVAQWAAREGVVLSVVRMVTDPAEVTLPGESMGWTRPNGRINMGAVLWYLIRHPTKIRLLMALKRHTEAAAKVLAGEARAWVEQRSRL